MVQDLQRVAERIGEFPGIAGFAMKIEHMASDGGRRVAAILQEIVPVAVAALGRVLGEGPEHVMAMPRRHADLVQALPHGKGGGRFRARRAVEDGAHASEAFHLLLRRKRRVVGDVVGLAGEAVEGVHMRAELAADEPGSRLENSRRRAPCPRASRDWRSAPTAPRRPSLPFAAQIGEDIADGKGPGNRHGHIPAWRNQAMASARPASAGRGA